MMSVSVVIPVGPGHETLAHRAMASAEAQTVQCETILVQDSDGHGAGWARNRGVEQASGDLLVFLDADDELAPEFVEESLLLFAETGRYVYTDWIWVSGGVEDPRQTPEYSLQTLFQRAFFHAVTTLLPRPWFTHIGGFNERLPTWEDVDLYYRLAQVGACGVRLPLPLLRYYADDGNRRWIGYQNRQTLWRAVRETYKESVVACSGCAKNRLPVPPSPFGAQAALPGSAGPFGPESPEAVEIEFTRRGAVAFTGLATRTRYPRSSAGDRLYVHRDDAVAEVNRLGGAYFRTLALPDRDVVAQVEAIRKRVAGVLS